MQLLRGLPHSRRLAKLVRGSSGPKKESSAAAIKRIDCGSCRGRSCCDHALCMEDRFRGLQTTFATWTVEDGRHLQREVARQPQLLAQVKLVARPHRGAAPHLVLQAQHRPQLPQPSRHCAWVASLSKALSCEVCIRTISTCKAK